MSHKVTLIPGDGVGPEVTDAARRVIDAAGVAIDWEVAEAGAEVFKKGDSSGVPKATRDSIERTRVALKGPLETPVGFGEKSANVTLRKLFEKYASGGGDGTNVPVGVLRKTVETGTDVNGQKYMGNIVISGILKLQKVSSANGGVAAGITTGLGAVTNDVIGTFKF